MPQNLTSTAIAFLDGSQGEAAVTGNNAAWMCPCGRELPLVGCSGLALGYRVNCPKCGRQYRIVPEGIDRTNVIRLEEVVRVEETD